MSKSRELLDLLPKGFTREYWIFVIKRRRWLRNTFLAFFLTVIAEIGAAYYYVFHYTDDLKNSNGQPIDLDRMAHATFKSASYIYASDGAITGRFFFEEIRDPVRLDEVPELLQKAFMSAEDKRFYSHPGVDIQAIVSAGIGNFLRSRGIKVWNRAYSGASTIDQQNTRLVYSEEIPEFGTREQTVSRKIKEARIAIQVAKKYPREKILENYLNRIYLGHSAHGVAEAARRYFGKDIRQDKLSLREIAILVSLNKSPALYCPIFHLRPEADEAERDIEVLRIANARDRYNWVLERMLDDGHITAEEYENVVFNKKDPPDMEFHLTPLKNPDYGYGNRLVKELLLGRGYTEEELSHYGGLRIYTTFDPKIQRIASEEFETQLALLNEGKNSQDRLNGAFIAIDVRTGRVLALSGGNDFNETQYNRVMASRSPGSGFKPLTYAAAIEYLHKDFFDKICNCPFRMRGANGKAWAPQNFHEDNPVPYGYIPLATGLIRSVNLPTLNLAREIGMKPIVQLANDMGIHGNPGMVRDSDGEIWLKQPGFEIKGGLVPLLPTAIGASDVNLLELANAYAVFFRGGVYLRPTLVSEIRSTYGEEVIYQPEEALSKRVLSEDTSNKMLALMRAVTKVGTAKISMRDIEQQVACKTGTSNGPKDVSIWCGTPELVIAVRFGMDDYRVIELPEYMAKVSGRADMQVTGGWVAGPMVRRIVDRIYSEREKVEFSPAVEAELQRILEHPNPQ